MESIPTSSPSSLSSPSSQINQDKFNNLVDAEEKILTNKYSKELTEEETKDINKLFSNIFKDFYSVQEKLMPYKKQKENNINNNEDNNIINTKDDNNINNDHNNDNDDIIFKENIDSILADIFFNSPFDKYTKEFYTICKKLSKEYLAQNILGEKKNLTFVDYLENEIFKTKIPNFIKNLLVMIITDNEQQEKDRFLMNEEEKKLLDEKIKKNERKEKNILIEDWDLDKVLYLLDTDKEKERLKPILKEMEDDLKPKPILLIRNEENCQINFLQNRAKFNIIAMNRYYMDMDNITICISGFLTENQEHFSGWKEFVRNNKQITFYYFLNWPSESGLSSFLYFNTAKKRANYFGKILANMIVSKKFFKNKKITLVGHSLGCHFIKCCLKEMAENADEDFQGEINKIEKIIFLGGATQIKNNKRWIDIFKKVTKGNIYNFYSNKDGALRIMQTSLVWGKNPIGRNPLILNGLNVYNYDCSNIEFEDTLNHGYKQIYGKIMRFFGL